MGKSKNKAFNEIRNHQQLCKSESALYATPGGLLRPTAKTATATAKGAIKWDGSRVAAISLETGFIKCLDYFSAIELGFETRKDDPGAIIFQILAVKPLPKQANDTTTETQYRFLMWDGEQSSGDFITAPGTKLSAAINRNAAAYQPYSFVRMRALNVYKITAPNLPTPRPMVVILDMDLLVPGNLVCRKVFESDCPFKILKKPSQHTTQGMEDLTTPSKSPFDDTIDSEEEFGKLVRLTEERKKNRAGGVHIEFKRPDMTPLPSLSQSSSQKSAAKGSSRKQLAWSSDDDDDDDIQEIPQADMSISIEFESKAIEELIMSKSRTPPLPFEREMETALERFDRLHLEETTKNLNLVPRAAPSDTASDGATAKKVDKAKIASSVEDMIKRPAASIDVLMRELDTLLFGGRLTKYGVKIGWSSRQTLCAGNCRYTAKTRECTIKLSKPLLSLRPRRDLLETLCHEMIHALVFITGGDPLLDHASHGPLFTMHMQRVNDLTGLNVTVYHSFHQEVNILRSIKKATKPQHHHATK